MSFVTDARLAAALKRLAIRPADPLDQAGASHLETRRAFLRNASLAGGLALVLPAARTVFAGPKPAGPEEAKFDRQIVTPSGTALGGSVELTLRADGSYKAHFHMHDSGAPDYKFEVRALFTAANGVAFAWQHSGKVEGTESTKLTRGPHRNSDADIEGNHPFIREFWPQIKAGKLSVSKEYGATGVIGFVEDAVKDVVEVAKAGAHAAAGAVVGLGDEMTKALNSLQLNGSIGIIGGVAVLVSGGTMVLALAAGVAAGAVTKALVKQRQITAEEYAFVGRVFGNTLPVRERLFITNLHSLNDRGFTIPSLSDDIFLNLGPGFPQPMTYVHEPYHRPGQLLVHEMTHAWQIHHRSFVPAWVCDGIITQAQNHNGSSYNYGPPTEPWGKFNIEQQGAVVDQWFGGTRVAGQKTEDPNDPYFHFIRDNIRAGRG